MLAPCRLRPISPAWDAERTSMIGAQTLSSEGEADEQQDRDSAVDAREH